MINRRQPWRAVLQSVASGLALASYSMARPATCAETNVVIISHVIWDFDLTTVFGTPPALFA